MTLTCAKFDADLVNISKVTSHRTKWPRLFWPTLYIYIYKFQMDQVITLIH